MPIRQPGIHIGNQRLTKALDFFKLFFTIELVNTMCNHTNVFAWMEILNKPTYGDSTGAWSEVTVEEMYRFIAVLIFMGFVDVKTLCRYWSTGTLYHGLWTRRLMKRDRFKAILSMLHVAEPGRNNNDKLRCVRPLLDHMKMKCKDLYQPEENVTVDERMVKSKGRSGIRQFVKGKPIRFGFKLWVLADMAGYTLDFDVYTGRRNQAGQHGLAYDVVVNLCQHLANQGYRVYFDCFFTSPILIQDLFTMGLLACGACQLTRRGIPNDLKDRMWGTAALRGHMRFLRQGILLFVQWKDSKACILTFCYPTSNNNFLLLSELKKCLTHEYITENMFI